jgi:hypothetical protein
MYVCIIHTYVCTYTHTHTHTHTHMALRMTPCACKVIRASVCGSAVTNSLECVCVCVCVCARARACGIRNKDVKKIM